MEASISASAMSATASALTAGVVTTVVKALPSSQTSPALGSESSGVASVAFIGHRLYALLAGAGATAMHDFPSHVLQHRLCR